jgi:hypothetical protein
MNGPAGPLTHELQLELSTCGWMRPFICISSMSDGEVRFLACLATAQASTHSAHLALAHASAAGQGLPFMRA